MTTERRVETPVRVVTGDPEVAIAESHNQRLDTAGTGHDDLAVPLERECTSFAAARSNGCGDFAVAVERAVERAIGVVAHEREDRLLSRSVASGGGACDEDLAVGLQDHLSSCVAQRAQIRDRGAPRTESRIERSIDIESGDREIVAARPADQDLAVRLYGNAVTGVIGRAERGGYLAEAWPGHGQYRRIIHGSDVQRERRRIAARAAVVHDQLEGAGRDARRVRGIDVAHAAQCTAPLRQVRGRALAN